VRELLVRQPLALHAPCLLWWETSEPA
jgi:hypothetical protein